MLNYAMPEGRIGFGAAQIFDSSKLRPQDQRDYAELYNKLQSIYTRNKDLYRNPLKHQSDFNAANSIVNEMRMIAAGSKEIAGTLADATKKQLDRYTPQARQMLRAYNDMSYRQIMAANGGRLPTQFDFDLVPDEINLEEAKKVAQAMAISSGAVADQGGKYYHKDDPDRVQEGMIRFVEKDVIDDRGIAGLSVNLLANPQYAERWKYEWENMDLPTRNAMSENVAGIPGIDFRNGAMVLAANFVKGNSVIREKEYMEDDKKWQAEQRAKIKADDRAYDMKKWRMTQARSDARANKVAKAMENKNVDAIGEAQENLRRASTAGSRDDFNAYLGKANTLTASVGNISHRKVFEKNPGETEEHFVNRVNDYQRELTVKEGSVTGTTSPAEYDMVIPDEDIRRAYKSNTPIVGMRTKKSYNDKGDWSESVYMLNPYGDDKHKKAWENNLKYSGISPKTGPFFGYEEE
jgi:hypothetical protein